MPRCVLIMIQAGPPEWPVDAWGAEVTGGVLVSLTVTEKLYVPGVRKAPKRSREPELSTKSDVESGRVPAVRDAV